MSNAYEVLRTFMKHLVIGFDRKKISFESAQSLSEFRKEFIEIASTARDSIYDYCIYSLSNLFDTVKNK